MHTEPADRSSEFVVELGRALHVAGAPAHRLEAAIDVLSAALGLQVNCLSQPTSLILDLGTHTRVLRVEPGEVHLERLVLIDAVASAVARRELSPAAGLERLRSISQAVPRYPEWLVHGAGALSAGSAAVYFDAPPLAVAVASGLGLGVALLGRLGRRFVGYGRLHELAASFAVAGVATCLGRVLPVSATLVTLAGIVSLLPGLTLTTALTELASRHLASGTARLMGAVVTLLQLAIGTALGWRLAAVLPRAIRPVGEPFSDLAQLALVPITAALFVVLFKARPRDYLWIMGVCMVSYSASAAGQDWLGPELGACVGGLVVGLLSNLQALVRRVPSAVTQVPALLLLVPGAVGFRGFGAMLDNDMTAGVDAGFSMLIIAASLVAGLLAAGVLLPPRRYL